MSEKKPKILIYDIETSLQIQASFGIYDEFTPHTNILVERHMVSACWQWFGDKKIHSVSLLDDPKRFAKDCHDDYHVVKTMHEVLSEADVIVAHYGDQFDKKYIDTRILFHGLPALQPLTSIDTKKIASQRFRFNSNKLDYIANYLGFGRKKHTPEGLWLDVLKGDKKAIKVMVDYNKHDVYLLGKVLEKFSPYVPNWVNRELYGGVGCPRCGSHKIQSRGYHKAISRVYRRWQCQSCSGWFKSTKAEPTSPKFRIL